MVKKQLFAFVCFIIGLASCHSTQDTASSTPKVGMFKVAILYPSGNDKSFDMEYYENKHMPMVAGFLGENLQFYEIDRSISGRTPTDAAPFVAIGYFYVNDIAEYNKAIEKNRDAIISDFKNYTTIQPIINISEIKQLVRPGRK